MRLLLLCLVVAVVIFLATSGHVLFLPLLLFLPLGFAGGAGGASSGASPHAAPPRSAAVPGHTGRCLRVGLRGRRTLRVSKGACVFSPPTPALVSPFSPYQNQPIGSSMDPAKQKVVQYLNEAHASEDALMRVLQSQIAMTPARQLPHAASRGTSTRRDATPSASDAAGRARAGRQPAAGRRRRRRDRRRPGAGARQDAARSRCAAPAARRRCSRTPRTPAPPRRWRSRPTPRSSGSRARVGDDETAKLAASIRADEEKMLERVMGELPKLTDAVVGADVKGDGPTTSPRPAPPTPSARPARRREGRAQDTARDQAHRAPGAQGPGRRAGRGRGQGRRRVASPTWRSRATTS